MILAPRQIEIRHFHLFCGLGSDRVGSGALSVADPRPPKPSDELHGKHRVTDWQEPARAVIAGRENGAAVVADPRLHDRPRFSSVYRIVPWHQPSSAVTGNGGPAMGVALADPRPGFGRGTHHNIYRVTPWDDPSKTITGGDHPSGGALCVSDPRPAYSRDGKDVYRTTGEYGVVPWEGIAGAVTAHGQHDNGQWSVADPNCAEPQTDQSACLPAATDRLVAFIRAIDGTYHRPFTTLELAALQSLVDPDEILELHGSSDSAWRERIGNAVPPDAATAIASVMAQTLLLAWAGETFHLSATPVWVRPIAIALSVQTESGQ